MDRRRVVERANGHRQQIVGRFGGFLGHAAAIEGVALDAPERLQP